MPQVNTVRGPVDVEQLGRTLMHEHIFVLTPEIMQNYAGWDEELRVSDAVQKLRDLERRGVTTIVDPTVIGLGRYIPRIQRIAEQTSINIVAATGLYTYNDVPHYFHFRGPGTLLDGPEIMVDMFVTDIEEGIAGTGVRAGILKCATDVEGVTPGVERVLRAVAQAHRRTGVNITTHTHAPSRRGLEQQRIFREEGVDLSRVVIGHSDDTTDCDYLEELIANGSYIGMDRFGIDVILPTEDRTRTVIEMCRRGHADRMVLSQDASCYIDWLDADVIKQVTPNWHYYHIVDNVVPALLQAGVSQEEIDLMLVENPKRFFSQQGAY